MEHCLKCDERCDELYDGLCDLCYYEWETCYGTLAGDSDTEVEEEETDENHDDGVADRLHRAGVR